MDPVVVNISSNGGGGGCALMPSFDPHLDPDPPIRSAAEAQTPRDSLTRALAEGGGKTAAMNAATFKTSSSNVSLPDVLSTELQSLQLHADDCDRLSFLLLDHRENLLIDSAEIFSRKLGCQSNTPVKVVAIVGNTGEGKSFALNAALFDGQEVFSTSPQQASCTIGVWAAFEPALNLVVLDTEGMLGLAGGGGGGGGNDNQRTRLLLKVLAVADVVVYKTRAERLHNDLFYFLGDASKSYNDHFSAELRRLGDTDETSLLGPTAVIFHETSYTDVLSRAVHGGGGGGGRTKSPEGVLRDRLAAMAQDVSAFSKIRYFGTRIGEDESTKNCINDGGGADGNRFQRLKALIAEEIQDTTARSPRSIDVVYKTLQALNNKFSGDLSGLSHRSFPDEYFTCLSKCSSCEARCSKAINHDDSHKTNVICRYQKQLENKLYLCKRCYESGRREIVIPKTSSAGESAWLGLASYAWSGYVLECSSCGVIYRSRAHWYGNQAPDNGPRNIVHAEIAHIWPGQRLLQGAPNAARVLLDEVSQVTAVVNQVTASPKNTMSKWVADQIAPDYWRPNADISSCRRCERRLGPSAAALLAAAAAGDIHHCRSCGDGFCESCSDYRRPVPDRGWGSEPVRVCRHCYDARRAAAAGAPPPQQQQINGQANEQKVDEEMVPAVAEVQARKYGEKVMGGLSSLALVFEYPVNLIKDTARPDYWVPDEEITDCFSCGSSFESMKLKIHHCRSCGHGVCGVCSSSRRPVPSRGWDQPVRVCDKCRRM